MSEMAHLKADDAGEVRLHVAVKQDVEPQVVVQQVLTALLQQQAFTIDTRPLASDPVSCPLNAIHQAKITRDAAECRSTQQPYRFARRQRAIPRAGIRLTSMRPTGKPRS